MRIARAMIESTGWDISDYGVDEGCHESKEHFFTQGELREKFRQFMVARGYIPGYFPNRLSKSGRRVDLDLAATPSSCITESYLPWRELQGIVPEENFEREWGQDEAILEAYYGD